MTDLRGTSVLVTGAGGFIGGHLATRLVREGANVRALVRYNGRNERGALDWFEPAETAEIDVVLGDLRDVESVAAAVGGTDVVFHLGAQIAIPYSFVNPRDFFETNVLGTLNAARAALDAGCSRFVHVSTSEVYGTARTVPITEDHPIEPQSPYAASKVGADKLVDSFHRTFELPSVTIRPFNTFGPHQSARAVLPTIMSQALAGGPLRLGSLDPKRDLTYVEDTVSAFVLAGTVAGVEGETIQLGTGEAVSIGELVERVGTILGRPLEVEHDAARVRPAASEVELLLSDPARAEALLGWTPELGLDEGLRRTLAYVERNLSRFRTQEYVV